MVLAPRLAWQPTSHGPGIDLALAIMVMGRRQNPLTSLSA